MGKKEQGSNRQYTGEFKAEAVRLGESIGGNAAAKRLRLSTYRSSGQKCWSISPIASLA